ncbi:hypothetical protein V8E36_004381 [Tilletia maclaganii]
MDDDAAGTNQRSGSGSPFVEVHAASYPYTPEAQAWLETFQTQVRSEVGASSRPVFLIEALLGIGAASKSSLVYPPLTAEERQAMLESAPSRRAQSQAIYYLLRDRALAPATAAADPSEALSFPIDAHPSATAWAARNPLRLTASQRKLADAFWLIDHGHLDLGVDILIALSTAHKAANVAQLLSAEVTRQLFFRLTVQAETQRSSLSTLPPAVRNHAGFLPHAHRRVVSFADAFQHAGIGSLFSTELSAAPGEHPALKAYAISLCHIKGLGQTWTWLNARLGSSQPHESSDLAYADLLLAVMESIAAPTPLRRQLNEAVYLPLSPSDVQIIEHFATSIPSSQVAKSSRSQSQARKARAVIAEVLFIRYMQSGAYAAALALDAQLEMQSLNFDPDTFQDSGLVVAEAEEIESRRKRRADLLRAARDVMPDVQRAFLDGKKVQDAMNTVGAGSTGAAANGGRSSKSTTTVEGSWQDVSQDDILNEDEHGTAGGDVDMDVAEPSSEPEQADTSLTPLTASAAFRGQSSSDAGADVSTRSASIVHASDPQAALISALVSNSIQALPPQNRPQKSTSSFDTSFTGRSSLSRGSGPQSQRRSGGLDLDARVNAQARNSPLSLVSPARQTPASSRASPFGARGRSSLAGGAPSPDAFGSPRRTFSGQLDPAAASAERSGSPGMHLAYLFRQPERRYVPSIELPSGADSGGASTERWAAEQNLRMDTEPDLGPSHSLVGADHFLPETPVEDIDDPANRTLTSSSNRRADAAEEDGDTSVRMPGAWDAPAGDASQSSGLRPRSGPANRRGTSNRTGGAKADQVRNGQGQKRSRRAVGAPPPTSVTDGQLGPVSSTPAAKRTTNVPVSGGGARNPRARAPPPPSGLRRMTRASSVLSSSSSGLDDAESLLGEEEGDDVAALPEMIEIEGNAPSTVSRSRPTTSASAPKKRASRAPVSTSETSQPKRRSSRLASQEPDGEETPTGHESVSDGPAAASGTETETEGSQVGEDEVEGSRSGRQGTRTGVASQGAKRPARARNSRRKQT